MNKTYIITRLIHYAVNSEMQFAGFITIYFLVKADVIGELIVRDDFIYASELKNVEILDYQKQYISKLSPISNKFLLQFVKLSVRLFLKEELKGITDDDSAKLYFKMNYEED